MAKKKKGVGPSNSFGYQGSFGNPPKKGVGPSNSFGYQGSSGFAQGAQNVQAAGPSVSPTGPGGAWEPSVGGRPLDPQEEAYRLGAGRNVTLAQGEGAYQRGQAEQFYGYGASGAANPYSQAALLEESYKRSKLGTTNNYASSGQLHSGAYGRMQGENQRQYSIGVDRNRREYDQTVHGINYGVAQTVANNGIGVDEETYKALLRALGIG